MRRIYFDYAATTPVDQRVARAMAPYFGVNYGNPGSLHSFGQEAIAALDQSRETIAKAIGADFREVIFTGSATEANNLAVRGVRRSKKKSRIIISAIEHESVLETARTLEKEGVEVVILPVDREGVVDVKKLTAALNEDTVLVSVMYANNEIGTVQSIAKIGEIIRNFRARNVVPQKATRTPTTPYPLFHTDAVQAFQYLDCSPEKLGVDLMTISAHKIYGPKGVGALFVRNMDTATRGMKKNKSVSRVAIPISPVTTGGGQEFGLRSGTENVPSIVGFREAVELVVPLREKERARAHELTVRFWKGIKKVYPHARLNGTPLGRSPSERRLPNVMSTWIPGTTSEDMLLRLAMAGIAASSGSACAARSAEPSPVLRAIGLSEAAARSSIRWSFGRMTTTNEIDKTLAIIKKLAHGTKK